MSYFLFYRFTRTLSGSINISTKKLEVNVCTIFVFKRTNYYFSLFNCEIFYYFKGQNSNVAEEINRTMVFQIGRTDLRLISPDRKQILLHKQLKDIIHCVQV